MTNKELQEELKKYPDDAEIIRYNVYKDMNAQWDGYEKVENLHIELGEFVDIRNLRNMFKGLLIRI